MENMTSRKKDLLDLTAKLQMDIRDMSKRLTELRAFIAALPDDETTKTRCPFCQLAMSGPKRLAEHLYQQHDGPEPQAWVDAEQRAEAT